MPDLYTLPNATSGIDEIMTETITAVPGFPAMLLAFIFFVVFLGGIARQKLRSGTSDYSMWMVIASISTLMIALILSTTTGFMRLDWLVIIVVVTILSGVWLFLDRRQSEV
jgi:ABC-type dipeptide/oligopeptide/nickel transport system permease subunit